MAVVLAAEKSFYNSIGNQNICIPTMAVSLASKTSNWTGTMFELKFVCFWINLEQIKNQKIPKFRANQNKRWAIGPSALARRVL